MMYRDDLAAAHARLEDLQRELTEASSQATQDQQRIAQLTAQLAAAREALARMGQVMPSYTGPQYIYASRATTVLVLGILSLAVCAVMGPIAWSMGNEELRRIEAGQTPSIARSSAVAGRICGIVSTSFLILGGFGMLVAIAMGLH